MKKIKIALIPWDEKIKNNSIFLEKYEGYIDSHILLKKSFENKGMELNTIDMYNNLTEVNCFLFFTISYKWLNRIISMGLQDRTVYCSGEPAVVKPENSKEGYDKLLRIFAFILTWNDDLVDNLRIFKRNIPYHFKKSYGNIPYENRKLLTNISGNKSSKEPFELYSEREKIIYFFEKYFPEEFDLYGTGWDINKHSSYKGVAENKIETYHKYKFALSLENTYNVKGYITEKIFDCFISGLVPIYKGASNIEEVIPKECYISYDDFNSLEQMESFLKNMSEKEYNNYLTAIDKLLSSDIQKSFSSDMFCENICSVLYKIGLVKLEIPQIYCLLLKIRERAENLNCCIMNIRITIKNILINIRP